MSEEPKHTVLLPPNDPARLCWKFLGDVLERAEVPPADPAAARDRLRALLLEAYQTRGYKLLRMALLGSGTGSMRGRIEAFVQSLRAHGIEIDTRMSSVPDADDVRTLLADPGWRSATNYILTRWWSMGDGRKTLARVAAYRVLDASTNEPIKAWLPERCGVVGRAGLSGLGQGQLAGLPLPLRRQSGGFRFVLLRVIAGLAARQRADQASPSPRVLFFGIVVHVVISLRFLGVVEIGTAIVVR